jgi:hypothetical protein
MHANQLKTGQLRQLQLTLVRLVPKMCTGSALTPVRPVTSTGQTGEQQIPEMARNHLKTF